MFLSFISLKLETQMYSPDCKSLIKCELVDRKAKVVIESVDMKCHEHAQCGLLLGLPHCVCKKGFFGDGTNFCDSKYNCKYTYFFAFFNFRRNSDRNAFIRRTIYTSYRELTFKTKLFIMSNINTLHSTKVLSDTLCIFARYFKKVYLRINSTHSSIKRV